MTKHKTQKNMAVISRTPAQVNVEINTMPEFEVDRMYKTLISCIKRAFENPAVQADYEVWKAARAQQKQEAL